MSTVDDRIVALKFDNKQFESGAQKSLSTLDKLKAKLDFDKSSKSLENLQKTASKGVDVSGMSTGIDKLQERFSTLGIVGMTIIQRITNAAIDAGKKVAGALVGPVVSGGWTRALNLEQAQFQIEGLGESWEAVKDDVLYGVKDTAYGLDEAAKVASQLLASQVKTGDEMKGVLRGISGVAAMTSSSYADIGNIFTTVAGRGKVTAEQLNQLAYRGLNGAASIATFFNKVNAGTANASEEVKNYVRELSGGMETTEADIRDMVKDGSISFKVFASAMDDAFGEHAKKANETFTGSLSNMKAALARIGADVAIPTLTALRDVFNTLTPKIDAAKEALQPLLDTLGKVVRVIADRVIKTIEKVDLSGLRKFSEGASNFLSKIFKLDKAYDDTTTNISSKKVDASKIEKVADALKTVTEEEAKAAWDIWIDGLYGVGEARKKNLEDAGLSYKNVQGFVNALYDANFDLSKVEIEVGKNGKAAQEEIIEAQKASIEETKRQTEALTPMQKVLEGFRNILGVFKNIGEGIVNLGKSIGKAFISVFSPDFFANGFLGFTNGLKTVSEAFKLTDERAEKLRTIFEGLFTVIKLVISGVGWLASAIVNVLAAAFSGLIDGVLTVSSKLADYIIKMRDAAAESERFQRAVEAFKGLGETIGNAFRAFFENIKLFFQEIHNSEGATALREELYQVWLIVKEKLLFVFDKFIGLIEKISGKEFKVDGFKGFADLIGRGLGAVAEFIRQLRTGEGKIGEFFSGVNSTSVENFKKFGNFIIRIKEPFLEFFRKLNLFKNLKNMGETIVKAAKALFENIDTEAIAEGFKSFFSKVYESLSKVDWDKLIDRILEIAKIVAAFKLIKSITQVAKSASKALTSAAGMFDSIGGLAKTAKTRVKVGIFKTFAEAILILVGAIWILSTIPTEKLKPAATTVLIAFGMMVGAMALLDKINAGAANVGRIGAAFAGMGAGILMIALACKALAKIDEKDLAKSITAITVLLGVMTLAARFSAGGTRGFASMALSLLLIVPALLIFSRLKWETILKGAAAITIVASSMALASRLAGSGGGLTMLAMALAIDMLIPPLLILAAFPVKKTIAAAAGLSGIMLALAGAAKIAGTAQGGAKTMLAMAVPIVAAGATLAVLARYDFANIIAAAAGMAGVMLASAAAIKIAGNAKGKIGAIITVAAAMAAACLTISIVAEHDFEKIVAASAGMSAVMLSAAGATKLAKGSLAGVLAMGAVMAEVAALFTYMMSLDADSERMLQISASLSLTLLSVAGALRILTAPPLDKASLTAGLKASLLLGEFIVGLVAILEILGGLKQIPGFMWLLEEGGEVLKKLGSIIGGFVGGIIESISDSVATSLASIGQGLSDFYTNAEPFINGVKNIDGSTMEGVGYLADAILTLTKSGILEGLTSWLTGGTDMVKFGQQLSEFAPYYMDFYEQIKTVDPEIITGASNAAKSLAEFANNIPGHGGLKQVFGGEKSLFLFAKELEEFAPAYVAYATEMKKVPNGGNEAVQASMNAAKTITEFATGIPNQGGLLAKITGDNSLAEFAKELQAFAGPYINFAYAMLRIPDGGNEAVIAASNAAQTIAEFAEKIPNTGGAIAMLTGDNSLADFGQQLAIFGPRFQRYAIAMEKINPAVVISSSAAATTIAEFATKIPNSGGLISWFTGDNRLDEFGRQLAIFGPQFQRYAMAMEGLPFADVRRSAVAATLIAEFATKIPNSGGMLSWFTGDNKLGPFGQQLATFGFWFEQYANHMTGLDFSAVRQSAVAAEVVAEFATKIPNSGGILSWFTGDNDLGTFGKQLATFGGWFKIYAENVKDIQISKLKGTAEHTSSMADLSAYVKDNAEGKSLYQFSEKLADFSKKFLEMHDNLTGISLTRVQNARNEVYKLVDMAIYAKLADNQTLTNFVSGLEEGAKTGVTGFCDAFINGKSDADTAISNFMSGLTSYNQNQSLYNSFYNTGDWAVAGIVNGLYAGSQEVYNAGSYLGQMASLGARNSLSVRSPSKVFERIGIYADEGLINGLLKMTSQVREAGSRLGFEAGDAVESSLSKLNTILNSEVDFDPVIAPVLDLSNVEAGAANINGILNSRPIGLDNFTRSYDLAARLDDNLDTTNKDVVDAITLLRGDLATYTDMLRNMDIMLDGQTLVGRLAPAIDTELGILAGYQERGI